MRTTRVNYYEYIRSPEWKTRSDAAKRRAGWRCQLCNAKASRLDTHHRTYDRLGAEMDEDLIVLCHECHEWFHQKGKLVEPEDDEDDEEEEYDDTRDDIYEGDGPTEEELMESYMDGIVNPCELETGLYHIVLSLNDFKSKLGFDVLQRSCACRFILSSELTIQHMSAFVTGHLGFHTPEGEQFVLVKYNGGRIFDIVSIFDDRLRVFDQTLSLDFYCQDTLSLVFGEFE